MADFFRYLMIGLGNGAIYAMIGLGLVVIYRASGLLNFSQGEITMFVTFIVWTLQDMGLPLVVAVAGGVLSGVVVGAVIQRIIVAPVGDPHQKPRAVVVVTIGLFLGINALAQVIWGTETRDMPALFGNGQLSLAGVAVGWQKLGALAVLGVEVALFAFAFKRTRVGLAMRAVASNAESAALVGVPVGRILMLGWGLAAALGAVAGTFTAPDRGMDSNLMLVMLVYAFAAITLGGFDSLVGAVVGGLIVGVATEVIPKYVDSLQTLPMVPAFVVIFGVLLVRPEGLFGAKKVTRV
ncbi:MAG: branched-chain amino acid ABC transporter permease [Microthrixaceae bacterium]|nr:branched-chain amino acid ABC transporter permease [Microthrixaceae bacterium]